MPPAPKAKSGKSGPRVYPGQGRDVRVVDKKRNYGTSLSRWAKQFGLPWSLKKQRRLRPKVRLMLQSPWHYPLSSMHLASTKIQSVVRMFLVKRIKQCGQLNLSWRSRYTRGGRCRPNFFPTLRASPPSSQSPRRPGSPNSSHPQHHVTLPTAAPLASERPPPPKRSLHSKFLSSVPLSFTNRYPLYCATKLAAWFRMVHYRRLTRFRLKQTYAIAALLVQQCFRRARQRRLEAHYILRPSSMRISKRDRAATKIQGLFRRSSGRHIYKFYRDLISFRLAGDPKQLLKTINPAEASLFDASVKVHVRFRLGGSAFPPTLYYKIFSSAPMCDVGSFAPRDYTVPAAANTHSNVAFHNKGAGPVPAAFSATVSVGRSSWAASGTLGADGTRGWYQRVENNGWRPVTVKARDELLEVPGSKKAPRQTFHFNKSVRKEDLEVMRKREKREWLRKMYAAGLATERQEGALDKATREAAVARTLQGASADYFRSHMRAAGGGGERFVEVDGVTGEVDVEVEKLLEWSQDLDFDNYIGNWATIGTSATSSKVGVSARRRGDEKKGDGDLEEERSADAFFSYGLPFSP